jgi:hypothetical protein
MAELKYDVAISFLSQDAQLAATLAARLADSFQVFFFPRQQEDLAGTDGLESLRAPFLSESRLAVVLYRDGWGETPWTGVEAVALKDRCLADQFRSVLFVVLDKAAKMPPWLPHTHIWLSYPEYGLEQAIGAIKARVQEQGGSFKPPTASSRAQLVRREQEYLNDKQHLFGDQRWIMETVHKARSAIFAEIERLVRQITAETGMRVDVGANDTQCVLTNQRVSLTVGWHQRYTNVLESDAIVAAGYYGAIPLPGAPAVWYIDRPEPRKRLTFGPELTIARDLCWVDKAKPAEHLSGEQVADRCVQLFFDLVGQANRDDHKQKGI